MFTKEYVRNLIRMIISVCIMGVCVSILVMTKFGPDPCSAMNYGMSDILGISFGNYQLCFNAVLFIVVFICGRSLLGPGTFANMILVGYAADLTTWFIQQVLGVTEMNGLLMRLGVMLPTLFVFIVAAAVYMNSGLGTAPYDAMVFLIHKLVCKKTGKDIRFRTVRMIYDAAVTCFALLIGGEAGLVTILMIALIGPAVDAVAGIMNKRKGKNNT